MVKASGEQLGQGGLGAVDAETPLQLLQFRHLKIRWVGPLTLCHQGFVSAQLLQGLSSPLAISLGV
jgi:hypothetical protein